MDKKFNIIESVLGGGSHNKQMNDLDGFLASLRLMPNIDLDEDGFDDDDYVDDGGGKRYITLNNDDLYTKDNTHQGKDRDRGGFNTGNIPNFKFERRKAQRERRAKKRESAESARDQQIAQQGRIGMPGFFTQTELGYLLRLPQALMNFSPIPIIELGIIPITSMFYRAVFDHYFTLGNRLEQKIIRFLIHYVNTVQDSPNLTSVELQADLNRRVLAKVHMRSKAVRDLITRNEQGARLQRIQLAEAKKKQAAKRAARVRYVTNKDGYSVLSNPPVNSSINGNNGSWTNTDDLAELVTPISQMIAALQHQGAPKAVPLVAGNKYYIARKAALHAAYKKKVSQGKAVTTPSEVVNDLVDASRGGKSRGDYKSDNALCTQSKGKFETDNQFSVLSNLCESEHSEDGEETKADPFDDRSNKDDYTYVPINSSPLIVNKLKQKPKSSKRSSPTLTIPATPKTESTTIKWTPKKPVIADQALEKVAMSNPAINSAKFTPITNKQATDDVPIRVFGSKTRFKEGVFVPLKVNKRREIEKINNTPGGVVYKLNVDDCLCDPVVLKPTQLRTELPPPKEKKEDKTSIVVPDPKKEEETTILPEYSKRPIYRSGISCDERKWSVFNIPDDESKKKTPASLKKFRSMTETKYLDTTPRSTDQSPTSVSNIEVPIIREQLFIGVPPEDPDDDLLTVRLYIHKDVRTQRSPYWLRPIINLIQDIRSCPTTCFGFDPRTDGTEYEHLKSISKLAPQFYANYWRDHSYDYSIQREVSKEILDHLASKGGNFRIQDGIVTTFISLVVRDLNITHENRPELVDTCRYFAQLRMVEQYMEKFMLPQHKYDIL